MLSSTVESLCGEFFNVFFGLPPLIQDFMRKRMLIELDTENAADSASLDFKSFNEQLKKLFRTGVRCGLSSDEEVAKVEKSYCREVLIACFTLIRHERWVCAGSPKLFDEGELIRKYPSFASVDQNELALLLHFRNLAAVFLSFQPAKNNKRCLLYVAGMLSANKIYCTGKKPPVESLRRVQIYEQEGGVVAKPRAVRSAVVTKSPKKKDSTQQHIFVLKHKPPRVVAHGLGKRPLASTTATDVLVEVTPSAASSRARKPHVLKNAESSCVTRRSKRSNQASPDDLSVLPASKRRKRSCASVTAAAAAAIPVSIVSGMVSDASEPWGLASDGSTTCASDSSVLSDLGTVEELDGFSFELDGEHSSLDSSAW